MFQSFVPNKNMKGIYNFKTGSGKSPSFFFFPDNNLLMLKTLKDSEKEILFDKGFLLSYFKHCMKHPDTTLMKIFGIFEIKIKGGKGIPFVLTENMVGLDGDRILRCFDLKGSLHGRYTKVSKKQLQEGTGLAALKDKNFLEINEISDDRRLLSIKDEERLKFLEKLNTDSKFLASHGLIDYSVFLIQVDRNMILHKKK